MRIIMYEGKKKQSRTILSRTRIWMKLEKPKRKHQSCVCVCVRERERESAKESVGVRTPNSDFAFISIHG